MTAYDSRADTLQHIHQVRDNITEFVSEMLTRAAIHDATKLLRPEKAAFDRETPKLKSLKFGTPEYTASLAALGPALSHHYAHNPHHPEHYPEGVAGMDLLDLVEMICDRKAAANRGADDGTVNLEAAVERFGIDPQLTSILRNTLDRWPSTLALPL